ncbi:MAG: RNA polymerase sigma factor [Bacteroidales bacterium]|nr:RNA polymerase sigma factor [Bacteroidales bacterium]
MHHTKNSGLTKWEEKTLKGCRQGKAGAQKKLYEAHAATMLGVCLRYVKNMAEAEDVLQEGFIKVFKNIDKFDRKGSLSGWIYRIMVNTALNFLRSKNKIQFAEYEGDLPADDEQDIYINEEYTQQQILEVIRDLPEGYRTVFNLYVIDGYKHREISDKLGISINTSKTQLAKARRMLRDKLLAIKGKEHYGRK